MRSPTWLSNALPQQNSLLLLLALLLGLAFTGRVWPATIGLDPSWQIALTKAHEQGLLWGKEFQFTYGPLGYLFFGSWLRQGQYLEMQIARLAISVGYFYLALRFISQTNQAGLKLLGSLALIIIPVVVDDMTGWDDKREIYFVLLSLLIIVDIDRSRIESQVKSDLARHWLKFYCYGVTGVLFLLIKFNVGLLAFVGFLTVALANVATDYLERERESLSRSMVALNSLLSGIFISLLSYSIAPTSGSLLTMLALYGLGFLSLIGIIWLRRSFAYFWTGLSEKLTGLRPQVILTALLIIPILLIFVSNGALQNFLLGSLQLSSGYSQSMATIGILRELTAGIVISVVIVFLGILAAIYQPNKLGISLCLFLFVLVSFKHGFIRHDDYHVILFTAIAPTYIFIASRLVFDQFIHKGQLKSLLKILVTVAAVYSLVLINWSSSDNLGTYLLRLNPTALVENITALIHPNSTESALLAQRSNNLKPSILGEPSIFSALTGQAVDILPWEVSVIEANALNWHPAPNFQTYSIYTRWLDRQNLVHYQQDPPTRLLYSFTTIDSRHPYFDQPQTNAFLLCHYQPMTEPAQLTKSLGKALILQPRSQPLCDPDRALPIAERTVAWGEPIDLTAIRANYGAASSSHLVARIDFRYSLLGKLTNFLFRTPPIYLKASYATGESHFYRLVMDNAQSDLVIGNLPKSLAEAFQDFEGQDSSNPVVSMVIVSPNQTAFQPQIHLTFSRILLVANPSPAVL